MTYRIGDDLRVENSRPESTLVRTGVLVWDARLLKLGASYTVAARIETKADDVADLCRHLIGNKLMQLLQGPC